jgi:hypothetical protein
LLIEYSKRQKPYNILFRMIPDKMAANKSAVGSWQLAVSWLTGNEFPWPLGRG